jgi:hypothetical protein
MVFESRDTLSDSFLPPPCYEPGADKGHEKESDDENPPHIQDAINTDASGSVTGGTTGAVGCIITPFAFLKTHFPY